MTPGERKRLVDAAEYRQLRDLAQEVGCPVCQAVIGVPCVGRWGGALRMEHPQRLTRAQALRAAGRVECTYCDRVRLTVEQREATPWPPEDQIVTCAWHRRAIAEITEAREMGCDWP